MPAYTKEDIRSLIDHAAQEQNILPLTSRCDARCVFCSHHNNPKEVQVISIGTRTMEEIAETMGHLRPDVPITIGESASSIIEGEPTLHPHFQEVMAALRMRFPQTPVEITTNGHHLTEQLVRFLAEHQPIMVNLSLNGGTVDSRRILMGDSEEFAKTAIRGVELLGEYGVPFSGSLVGMPNLTGFDDMEASIRHLADHGARTVRVFLPGFSQWVREDIFPDPDTIYGQLKEFINGLSEDIRCPVLLEPSYVQDLTPAASGVTMGSPAWEAGVRRGDVFTLINGDVPRSRTEAYAMLHARREVKAKVRRGEKLFTAKWVNGNEGSGVTMEYDFDLEQAAYIKTVIDSAPGFVLALSSEFGHDVLCAALDAVGVSRESYTAVAVPNRTFGGTIRAAGLLCCCDYQAAFEDYCRENPRPAGVILPRISFNALGRDLKGVHISELQKALGVPVAVS